MNVLLLYLPVLHKACIQNAVGLKNYVITENRKELEKVISSTTFACFDTIVCITAVVKWHGKDGLSLLYSTR